MPLFYVYVYTCGTTGPHVQHEYSSRCTSSNDGRRQPASRTSTDLKTSLEARQAAPVDTATDYFHFSYYRCLYVKPRATRTCCRSTSPRASCTMHCSVDRSETPPPPGRSRGDQPRDSGCRARNTSGSEAACGHCSLHRAPPPSPSQQL